MESYEALRRAINKVGAKNVAAKMKLSAALVYKWCEAPAVDAHGEASGSRNPLDRIAQVYQLTGDDALVGWLCRRARGFLVKNPTPNVNVDAGVLAATQAMVKEFSDVLEAVSESVTNGEGVDETEAGRIRKEWEELKCLSESFVVACETGRFDGRTE